MLTCTQSINRRLRPSFRTGNLPLAFTPQSHETVTKTPLIVCFVATNIFIVQYCTLSSLEQLILHCGLPESVHIALLVSRKCIMVYILLSNNIVTGYKAEERSGWIIFRAVAALIQLTTTAPYHGRSR